MAGKYGTTGHGGVVISDKYGHIFFVKEPAPRCDRDMTKLKGASLHFFESSSDNPRGTIIV